MKNYLVPLALCFAVTACGSSDESNSNEIPSKPTTPPITNTAPELSGVFSIEAKAAASSDFLFSTSDAEGDELTFTIDNAPNWLTFTTTDNQVKLTAQPTLFDIENYQMTVNLSDGTDSLSYELILNVVDNQQAWEKLSLTYEQLKGTWGTETGVSISFLDSRKGLYIDGDMINPIGWTHDNYNSNDSKVYVSVYPQGCIEECYSLESYDIQVVAHEGDKFRAKILDSANIEKVYTFTKHNRISELSDKYVRYPTVSYNSLQHVNLADSSLRFGILFDELPIGNYTNTLVVDYKGNLVADSLGKYLSIPTVESEVAQVDGHFYQYDTGLYTYLQFELSINEIKISALTEQKIIYEIDYQLKLTSDIGDTPLSGFEGLDNLLQPQSIYDIAQSTKQVNVPTVELGKNYSGRILNQKIDLTGTEYAAGGSVFSFVSSETGESELYVPGAEKSMKLDFTWSATDTEINVEIEGEVKPLHFYEIEGETYISQSYSDSNGDVTSTLYPFVEVTDTTFVESDYVGLYQHQINSLFGDGNDELLINSDGTGGYWQNYADHFTQFESNGSISFINGYYCLSATSFDECLTSALENSEEYLVVRNLKKLTSDSDRDLFVYSLWQTGPNYDYAYQSLRYFSQKQD